MISHCYIDDLIKNLVLLIEKGIIGRTYITATEKSIGFFESVRLLANSVGIKFRFIKVPSAMVVFIADWIERISVFLRIRPFVTKRNVLAASIDRVYDFHSNQEDIGFISDVTMEEGLSKLASYYIEQRLI